MDNPSLNGAAVDISAFMPEDVAEYDVKAPGTEVPTGWKITFAGPSHPKSLKWAEESARDRLREQRLIEQQQANGRKVKIPEKELEAERARNMRWVVSRIINWTPAVKVPIVEFPDAVPFSDDNAIALLGHPKMAWAFAQIVDYLTDEKSFTGRSGTTS